MTPQQIHDFASTVSRGAPTQLMTLGGQAHFQFFYESGALKLVYGEGSIGEVPVQLFNAVVARYAQLNPEQRGMTVMYGNAWPGCPNLILSPYVGRIVQYFDRGE